MIQGLRWLWQGDLEELVRRACGVGQGNIEECKAWGGFGEVDRRYEKEGDEEHRERGRQRGKEKKKKRPGERERKRPEKKKIYNRATVSCYW